MTPRIKNLSERNSLLIVGIFYTVLVTVAFLSPATDLPGISVPYFDKLVHIIIHWILLLIWLWYTKLADQSHISNKIIVVVLMTCFLYGCSIEVLQHWFTTSRNFDVFDIVANGIGSVLGLISFRLLRNKEVK
ncbi:VanZ family protein [Altibacter sp.]|uniref:VanZ family protein n=1 Tax=Altibacter sp. TaxID=2024823 RepID=UPI00338DCB67